MIMQYIIYFVPDDGVNGEPDVHYAAIHARCNSREEVAKVARAYLDKQWAEEREYYGEHYDRGVATLESYAKHSISIATVSVEYGELVIVSPHAALCMAAAAIKDPTL